MTAEQNVIMKTAHDWLLEPQVQQFEGKALVIASPNDWRHDDGVTMETPITLIDFLSRSSECTKYSRRVTEATLSTH